MGLELLEATEDGDRALDEIGDLLQQGRLPLDVDQAAGLGCAGVRVGDDPAQTTCLFLENLTRITAPSSVELLEHDV